MNSYTSSYTESMTSNDDLNQARIQGDQTFSICFHSTQSKSKRSNKKLLDQNEQYDFRGSISELIKSLQSQQKLTTPMSKKQSKKKVDLTKTMSIKGKKGKLYEDICPVCLAQYSFPIGVLQCRHKFCFDCIEQWSKTSTNCPCCRKMYDKIIKKDQKNSISQIKVQKKQMVFRQQDYFVCYVCGRGDHQNVLLVCDMCDYYCCHIFCDPSLNNTIPEGDWFCRNCESNVHNRGGISFNTTISPISSNSHEDDQSQQKQDEDKPIAARTRSRAQDLQVNLFRRIRRRR